jgi:sugar O-acyltransferase (sialic acid O-acetyltransferase NeuD family)
MKPLIIFGTGKIAEVTAHYFSRSSKRDIAAFTVLKSHKFQDNFLGLPVVEFEKILIAYPPDRYDMFIAVGYQELNNLRARLCRDAKILGYRLASYIDERLIGSLTSHGENCFVMDGANIHPCVSLGNNVFVWSGAIVGHHCDLGDNNWITSGCSIGGSVTSGDSCLFLINSTVGNGVKIASRCILGANSLVTNDTKENEVFITQSTKPFRLLSDEFIGYSTMK